MLSSSTTLRPRGGYNYNTYTSSLKSQMRDVSVVMNFATRHGVISEDSSEAEHSSCHLA